MNVAGSQDRRILEWSNTIQNLVWSPNGNRLASTSNQELFVVLADGEDFDVLVRKDVRDVSPAWSPQGNQIAFVKSMNEAENTAEVAVFESKLRHGFSLFGNFDL
jgi:hypothetical protein